MKRLKFKPHLVESILNGSKTITWRLFDDKDLSVGDILELVDSDSGDKITNAEISSVVSVAIKDLSDIQMKVNGYENREQVVELNRKYYVGLNRKSCSDQVNEDTIIKIVTFKII